MNPIEWAFHTWPHSAESGAMDGGIEARLIVAGLALLLDAALGSGAGLLRRYGPAGLAAGLLGWAGRRLNRPQRSAGDRRSRGAIILILFTLLAVAVGSELSRLDTQTGWGWLVELVVASGMIAPMRGYRDAVRLGRALDAGRIATPDRHAVLRRAIEMLAREFCRRAVAPNLAYLLFGLPMLLAYGVVTTGARLFSLHNPAARDFGFAFGLSADLLDAIPARIGGAILAAAAIFVPRGRPAAAMAAIFRDGNRDATLAALAGALDLALAARDPGARRVGAGSAWIGTGRAKAEVQDLSRALALYAVACLLLLGAIAVGIAALASRAPNVVTL